MPICQEPEKLVQLLCVGQPVERAILNASDFTDQTGQKQLLVIFWNSEEQLFYKVTGKEPHNKIDSVFNVMLFFSFQAI